MGGAAHAFAVPDWAPAGGQEAGESRERATIEAAGLWWELAAQAPAGRLAAVQRDRRCHTVAFLDRCLGRSEELLAAEPEAALEAARMAVAVAGRLALDPEAKADLEGLAWCALGRARCRSGDLAGAFQAARVAIGRARRGSREGRIKAAALFLQAQVLRRRGRIRRALAILAAVAFFHQQHGDMERVSEVLLEQAACLAPAQPEAAAALAQEAARAFERPEHHPLALRARTAAAWYLLLAGKVAAAVAALGRARLLAPAADPASEADLCWLEGRLARELDLPRQAEACLSRSAELLRHVQRWESAARVDLELAELYRAGGRWAEAVARIEGLYVLLDRAGMGRECLRRVLAAREDVRRDPAALRSLAGYLESAWYGRERGFAAAEES